MRRFVLSVLALVLVALLLRTVVPVGMQMLRGDLSYYQNEQTQMALEYLAEKVGIDQRDVQIRGGSNSPFLYGNFERKFQVGEKQYMVVHENTRWRQFWGLKGKFADMP